MLHILLSMALSFLPPTDPRLNEECEQVCPCEIISEEIQQIIDQMFWVAFGETGDRTKRIMVGLAAPQIGIQKRIILVDTAATGVFTKDEEPPPPRMEVFINPEILWRSEEQVLWREGCYSTGSICGVVPRSKQILIRAYDREGNLITHEYEGYVARIFQHEIDHLDGVRFPDKVSGDEDLHWVEIKEYPEYRINWRNWPRKCSRTQWLEMKCGHN